MDDLHTSSLFLMRLGSTDFIMRVRATSTLSKMSDIRVYSIQEIRHLIAWFPNSVLIMTRFFDRQNSFQLVFFFKRQPFSPFFRWSKKVCACVAVMYVSLFEQVLFQLTVRENGFKKCFQTSLINLDDALKNSRRIDFVRCQYYSISLSGAGKWNTSPEAKTN